MNQYETSWTPDRIKMAFDLWKQGYSASQIATQLGVITRNAVIGKISRAGLKRSDQALDATYALANVRQPAKPKAVKTAPKQPRSPSQSRPLTEAPQEQPSATPIALVDLRSHHCRWPIGDPGREGFHFCGARKADGGVYCAKHGLVAFQPTSSAKELARSLRKYA